MTWRISLDDQRNDDYQDLKSCLSLQRLTTTLSHRTETDKDTIKRSCRPRWRMQDHHAVPDCFDKCQLIVYQRQIISAIQNNFVRVIEHRQQQRPGASNNATSARAIDA